MSVNRRLAVSVVVLAACLSLAPAPASAATLLVNASGILTGATGVNVGSTLYDVEFVDGYCLDIFTGCDELTDFTFTTQADAVAASQALLDQVFVDVIGGGQFDSTPNLTLGCSSFDLCSASTPYALSAGSFGHAVARNFSNLSDDTLSPVSFLPPTVNYASLPTLVFARWSPAPDTTPVPEPTSLTLLGLGLAGTALRRWRQRKAS